MPTKGNAPILPVGNVMGLPVGWEMAGQATSAPAAGAVQEKSDTTSDIKPDDTKSADTKSDDAKSEEKEREKVKVKVPYNPWEYTSASLD